MCICSSLQCKQYKYPGLICSHPQKAFQRYEFIKLIAVSFPFSGFPISGFQVDAVDQVVLNLQDEVQQTWQPGDQIVVASTDYSMHQAEEFTLLPCAHCSSRQVLIQGEWTAAPVASLVLFNQPPHPSSTYMRWVFLM